MFRLLTKCNQTLIPKSHHHHFQSLYNIILITSNFSTSSSISSSISSNISTSISLIKQQKTSTATDLLVSWGFKPSTKPVSVVDYFKRFGFSNTQIKTMIPKAPSILVLNVSRILRPKIDFLVSIGLSQQDVIKVVILHPRILYLSLHNTIVPSFDLLKHFCGDQETAVDKIKQWPTILGGEICGCLAPNAKTLQDFGVPEPQVVKMVSRLIGRGTCANTKPDRFRKVVATVMEMGFDPSSLSFQRAVKAMAGTSERGWLNKLNVYKSLGLSEEEIHDMFKKQPISLWLSEEKIRAMSKFYFEKFSWSPSHLLKYPNALTYSLDKRVVPRCSVWHVLALSNKVKNVSVLTLLNQNEKKFMERYISNYKDEIPEVLDAYHGKIKFDEFNFDLE